METSALTRKRAEAIKESILRELKEETGMLSDFMEQLKNCETQIYIGNTEANNEETLSNLQTQVQRKNKKVVELNNNLVLIESTILFREKHPKRKIPINAGMYTGECEICHTQIPHKQQIARCAPQLCVPCANKPTLRK